MAAALAQAFEHLAREDGWDGASPDGRRRWSEAARAEAVGADGDADAAPA